MTYREHFEKAKQEGHEWAEAAIRNTDEDLIDKTPVFASTPCDLIASAFQWDAIPEGMKYWGAIYYTLRERPAGTGRV